MHNYVCMHSMQSLISSREVLHIVMELVPGGELFEAISRGGRLSEKTTQRLTTQILKTLAYLHKAGIVHRDLKPENVLLTDRNVDRADIKIADFGLSCLCGPSEKLVQPCGTLAYVAPEVLTLQGYNHRVDMWSLGVMVYLLLSGKLPFPIMRNSGVAVLTEREVKPCRPPLGLLSSSGPSPSQERVCMQKFYVPKFDAPAWKTVSRSAQDFIQKLLIIDPAQRMTGEEALAHIWIKVSQ